MLGLAVTKVDIDVVAGNLLLDIKAKLALATQVKEFLDTKTTEELEALGYTAQEVAVLKSAINDAAQLAQIYSGAATLAVAKDFRTFQKQLYGLGIR